MISKVLKASITSSSTFQVVFRTQSQSFSGLYNTTPCFRFTQGSGNRKSTSNKGKQDSTMSRIASQLRTQQETATKANLSNPYQSDKKHRPEKSEHKKFSAKGEKPIQKLSDLMNKQSPVTPIDNITAQQLDNTQQEVLTKPAQPIRSEKEEDEAQNFKLDVPWDFVYTITKQPEGNLKCSMSPEKLLNHKVAVSLFKEYVQALEEYDVDSLREILEYSFWERCSNSLLKMNKRGYKFVVEDINTKKTKMDLYHISNIFAVGAETNRKLNDGIEHYYIFDNNIEGNPTKNIIKQKTTGNENATVKVILDITVETPIRIQLFDGKGVLVGEATEKQGIYYHHMKIENDIMQVNYALYKRVLEEGGEPDEETLKQFKNVFSQENWKIIDFDNYMSGNPIVRARVAIF